MSDGRRIAFLGVVFLLAEERQFAMDNSSWDLIERALDSGRMDEFAVMTPRRKSFV
ncbi:MAG TPA: hypothetical protein VG944_12050 [Fimbriimonas sp.]|nr:hypothetical protein [Fimbriimonas sp.]